MGDDPFKSRLVAVHLVQRRYAAIEPVEVADQVLDAGVPLLPQQVPVERLIVIPFALLAEFAAHEQELLAGMAEHETVIGAQVCKPLPLVARHAAEDRAFAVHDFVMRQRQNEILRKRVMQAEQDVAVMVLPVHRILADIFQRVVHPAHVPFEAEAEPAILDRLRDLRPCGGFLRGRGSFRKMPEQFDVEAAQEFDGFEVFPAAVPVRNPLAGGPAVVEVEHRGDGIDAQAVDAVAIEPEQRVGDQEVDHFGAAVIVDQRAPVEVAALQGIGVFVERGAVEIAEPMRIVGEMSGHPVEPYADPFAMAGIDKRGKVFRRAEPAGRRVQPGRLIAPRSVERMLADGQKLEMGKAHVLRIGRKLFGELAIAQPFVAVLAPPRAEMNLVDRDRRAERVDARWRRLRMRGSCFRRRRSRPSRAGSPPRRPPDRISAADAGRRAGDVELVAVAGAGMRARTIPNSRRRAPASDGAAHSRN